MISFKQIKRYLSYKNPYYVVGAFIKDYAPRHMSDKFWLKVTWYQMYGKKLDLSHPKTFNEKIQWFKVYDHNPIYTQLVDKYEAKKYVAEKIGPEHVIPTLAVYDSVDEIDLDKLPEQFVLKCTHDCGSVIICRNKENFDLISAKESLECSLSRNFYWKHREWQYKNVPKRIIAEKYMEQSDGTSLMDYKFFCFNGEPKLLYVSQGLENHETARVSFVSIDWDRSPFHRRDYSSFDILPPKPDHFEEMKQIANVLSDGFPFVRIDLYQINDQVFFSEYTFTPCNGTMPFEPESWDLELGNWIAY